MVDRDLLPENTLLFHLEELRRRLLKIFLVTALLYPAGYFLSPYLITFLVSHAFPGGVEKLYYFTPMEVFFVRLKLALIIALVAAYPYNISQLWGFILPALYPDEKKKLGAWLFFSTFLFLGGAVFCIGLILPLIMEFSAGFASAELQMMLGIGAFLNLAGALTLAFGIMFQAPIAVMLAVRFGVIEKSSLNKIRPYVMTVILIIAGILTPPDIVSQLLLALPTWMLFELGVLLARKVKD